MRHRLMCLLVNANWRRYDDRQRQPTDVKRAYREDYLEDDKNLSRDGDVQLGEKANLTPRLQEV